MVHYERWENDVDFILGYLEASKRNNYPPTRVLDILIFILKSQKEIMEKLGNK